MIGDSEYVTAGYVSPRFLTLVLNESGEYDEKLVYIGNTKGEGDENDVYVSRTELYEYLCALRANARAKK